MGLNIDELEERFTARFNEAMAIRNIGIAELSKHTGIPSRTLRHWARGDRIPVLGDHRRKLLAKALGISLAWLNGLDVERDEEASNARAKDRDE